MKFAAVLFALGLFGLALGSKDPVCDETPGFAGQCRALAFYWTYYPAENECRLFKYGGCQGNGNSFLNQEACEEKCKT